MDVAIFFENKSKTKFGSRFGNTSDIIDHVDVAQESAIISILFTTN